MRWLWVPKFLINVWIKILSHSYLVNLYMISASVVVGILIKVVCFYCWKMDFFYSHHQKLWVWNFHQWLVDIILSMYQISYWFNTWSYKELLSLLPSLYNYYYMLKGLEYNYRYIFRYWVFQLIVNFLRICLVVVSLETRA